MLMILISGLMAGPTVCFDSTGVFNYDTGTGRIASITLVYDSHLVRDVVRDKYP